MAVYAVLDVGFFVLHSGLILFVVFGWLWRPLRKANLAAILMTGFSWFVLGFWYGFGYCPCTEWHWRVRERLGRGEMPASYIKFLFDTFTGLDAPAPWVDAFTVAVFLAALAASIYVNVRDFHKSRQRA